MAASPLDNSEGPLGVTVVINGAPIADSIAVTSVHVTQDLQHPARAQLQCENGDIALGEFPLMDDAAFGAPSDIKLTGFYGDGAEQPLFTGRATDKKMTVDQNGCHVSLICEGPTSDRTFDPALPPSLTLTLGVDVIRLELTQDATGQITGTCDYQGTSRAKPGDTVEISSAGKTSDGIYCVASVSQTITAGTWITTAQLYRPADD